MDQEALVSNLRKFANRLEKAEGPVTLLLLVAPETEVSDAWNVIVSSSALDRRPLGEAVRKVVDYLRASVDAKLWPSIARTTVLRTDDPFVISFRNTYPKLAPGSVLQSVNVSGVEIPRAVVVETKKQAA